MSTRPRGARSRRRPRILHAAVATLQDGMLWSVAGRPLPTDHQPLRTHLEDETVSTHTAEQLTRKKCTPCEGGVPPLSGDEAQALLNSVDGWHLSHDGQRIRREWTAKNFMAALDFFNKVAALAEEEGHHPELLPRQIRFSRINGLRHMQHRDGGNSS